ncbi:MAG: 6-carboxytetrahydropterin synthase [Myxococcota bacterium]|nr:6-carboxytetrahydropterin synthase [Myxococcota bacterium]
MYRLIKGIDIDFSHHVRGHGGPCINIHGHTWRFEVMLAAQELDDDGFVLDFKVLKTRVLAPCHRLLDHAFAVGESTWAEARMGLEATGRALVDSRLPRHGTIDTQPRPPMDLHGARLEYPGDMKVAVFPFAPTSERLAKWLYDLSVAQLSDGRVSVLLARIYETQRPVESVAEYGPS